MEVFAVFRGGRWMEYAPRMILKSDPRVTQPLYQKAAAAYVTALQSGKSEERAHVLAEATVFKSLYEGLQYEKAFEAELNSLTGREGRA